MSAPTITVTPTTVVFGEQQDLGTSTQAVETLVFDANGDGLQDLVLNGRNSNTISLMLNQGDGSFGAATTIATGSQWHIYNGDIDGDGNQDVLMTRWNEDYSEQTLGYLKNNGDGTFGAFETLETGFRNILDVTTVDFDGDGDLDVLTAGSGDAGVMIAKNNGDGTFTKSLLATGTSVYSVSTGDINGDGILDVVTTDGGGNFKAFTVGADGQSTQTHLFNLDAIYPAESVELVDLDGDGALDAVVANSNRKELSWLKGNGDGTFGPKQTIADGNEQSPYVTGFRVVDVNGDGRLDIIAGSPRTVGETAQTQQSYLSWFEQEADGTFTEHMTNVKYPSEADFFDVNYGDLNNDGVIDLISAGPVSIGGSRNYVRFATGMEAIEVAENAPTALHGIAFSDDSTGAVEVTLSVDRGTLEATSAAGVTVSGSGSQVVLTGTVADINAFLENDGVLFTTANNDETSAKLNITIDDQDPLNPSVVSKTIGLAVTPADDLSPVDVELSGDTVAEDAAIGTLIGTLSATDPEGGPVTYSLYSGGQYVTLDGNQLKLNTALDFEGQSSFQIIVRATDEGGAFTDQTLTIDVTNANEAPLSIALSKLLVPQSSAAGTVVGDLTTTDPDSGDTFTYSIPGGSDAFEIVDNKLVVKDLSGALIHDVKVLATDSGGLTVEKSFRITTTDDDGNPLGSAGTITIDASNAASMDFEAYIRGGFLAGTVGGGMPVFDNGGAFSGSEVMMAYGSDAASKYVLARGSMEYYFATHTIWGEIGTIEYGTRGNGAYDSSGSYQGGAAELRITGLSLSNNKPIGADEAEIEVNGPVHNFTVAHMYGDIGSTARIGVYSDSLDAYAQNYIGSAGADVFTGTVFADTINGGAGDDTLNGGGGNDTIRIGTGNDIVDGGDGIDTVIVDGNFADYNLLALSTIYLTENASGEMDRIRTTEYIKFKDALYNVATQEVTPIEDLAPAGLDISAKTVSENVAIGTVVGTFSATDPEGGALAYTLTSDAGGLFRLDGAKLVTAKAIDYETVKSATVTVEVSDGVNIVAESFTIGVTDVNEAPTALALSKSSVAENAKVGTVVGTLSAKDPEGGAVSYSLSSNPGGIFKVVGNQLQLAKAVDYETARSHAVTVVAKDSSGNSTSKALSIKVTNVDEAPTALSLSKATVAETAKAGTTIGKLSAKDPEGGAVSYSLSSNPGGLFKIVGNSLQLAKGVDYEKAKSHAVTVVATDVGGKTTSKSFSIGVTNVNEAPTSIALSKSTVAENSKKGTTVGTFSAKDPEGKALAYKLTDTAGGLFKLSGTKLQVAKAIDYEKVQSDKVTVRVTDADGKSASKTFTIKIGDVVETISGTSKGETLKGGVGADLIKGNGGNDKLYGYAGADQLKGGSGNDTLIGGAGADRLDGGSGSDTASYAGASKGVTASLAKASINTNDAKGDKYVSIENLTGTSHADKLTGNGSANVLTGGNGNDVLSGGGGNDTLVGGSGADVLKGGTGKDTLYGGKGADDLYGGGGKDVFVFKAVSDSTKSARDTIFDFGSGDIIDLKAIDANTTKSGNQAFSFIGTDAFSDKAGELRYSKSGKDTYVTADVNGDGKADFALHIDKLVTLDKGDFLL